MTTSTMTTSTPVETVFRARDLVKIYDMGEVQVHALRGVIAHPGDKIDDGTRVVAQSAL